MFDTVVVGCRAIGSIPRHRRRGELENGAALSIRRGRRFYVCDVLVTWSDVGREERGAMDPSNDERMRRENELRGRVAEESLALPVGGSDASGRAEGKRQHRGDELRTRWTLHAVQSDFVSCRERFSLYIGGIGSGKTWAGAVRAITTAWEHPGALGLIGAPTYTMLRDTTQ
jgi:hypothetical protein